jgi:Glycosyl transferase family 2
VTAVLNGIASFRSGVRVARPPTTPSRAPRVSVVVPCYNYGHYLPSCLASALDQPGVQVDVVVVDDASPDGSGDVAEQLAAVDSRITVIRHNRNTGHITTYNDGLKAAEGDYLVLLSADDLLTTGSLARSAALLEAQPSVGFAYGRALEFSGEPPTGPTGKVRSWTIWDGHDWLRMRWRTARNCIRSPEVMMRASVQRRIGGYQAELRHTADLEMWMRAAAISDVGHVDGPNQAYYRVHSSSMHITTFQQANARGALVDLRERRLTFERLARQAPSPTDIVAARQALAIEALTVSARSLTSDQTDLTLLQDLTDFAVDVYPNARQLRQWRPVERLLTVGPSRAKRHPSFLVRELIERGIDVGRRWRWAHRGV